MNLCNFARNFAFYDCTCWKIKKRMVVWIVLYSIRQSSRIAPAQLDSGPVVQFIQFRPADFSASIPSKHDICYYIVYTLSLVYVIHIYLTVQIRFVTTSFLVWSIHPSLTLNERTTYSSLIIPIQL